LVRHTNAAQHNSVIDDRVLYLFFDCEIKRFKKSISGRAKLSRTIALFLLLTSCLWLKFLEMRRQSSTDFCSTKFQCCRTNGSAHREPSMVHITGNRSLCLIHAIKQQEKSSEPHAHRCARRVSLGSFRAGKMHGKLTVTLLPLEVCWQRGFRAQVSHVWSWVGLSVFVVVGFAFGAS
jgi:hypothetical protein